MRLSFALACFVLKQEVLLIKTAFAGNAAEYHTQPLEYDEFEIDELQIDHEGRLYQAENHSSEKFGTRREMVDSSCRLFMAESSIPNSGLGLYTAIPLKAGDPIGNPEIVLNIQNIEMNWTPMLSFSEEERLLLKKTIKNKADMDRSCALWAEQGECERNSVYMKDQCGRSCAVKETGLDIRSHLFDASDNSEDCQYFAKEGECEDNPEYMLPNCPLSCFMVHNGLDKKLNDVQFLPTDYIWSKDSTRSQYENSLLSSIVAGKGALPNSHMGLLNLDLLAPSVDTMGYHRSRDAGVGAFSTRHNLKFEATENVPAGMELFTDYGGDWWDSREDGMGQIPRKEHYSQADLVLEFFWEDWDDYGSSSANITEVYSKTVESITDPMVKMLMPKTVEEAESIKGSKAALLSVPNVIQSQDWLNENGMCIDNIYAGQSSIPQAGRGAFARRNMKSGFVISPMPLMHINKDLLLTFDNLEEKGQQMIMNYVFGHEKSSLVLLPYAPIVNFVNNHVDKSKINAMIRWSKHPHHKKSWENNSVKDVLANQQAGLVLELVATTDIAQDEEIYIDYGSRWDKAWADHVENWKPPPRSDEYMSVGELNNAKEVKTEFERISDPLGYNVKTMCWLNAHSFLLAMSHGYSEFRWEDYAIEIDQQLQDDSSLIDCKVSERYESGQNGSTLYQIYIELFNREEGNEVDIFIDDVPREAIYFVDEPLTSDEFIEDAFRHMIDIPDDIFPKSWMDLDLSDTTHE